MSSHHFVREGQEPALLILDPLSLTLVEPLLEWAPVVMVSDSAIVEVLKWKIKIDVVLFQQDAVRTYADEIGNQGPVEILHYSRTENIPDMVVTFLRLRKYRGVNVIARPSPDVFDRWLPNVFELDISIIDSNTKWSAIQSTFQKWLPQKTKLDVRCHSKASLKFGGLIRDTHQSFLTDSDGIALLQSDAPFWLGEPLDG